MELLYVAGALVAGGVIVHFSRKPLRKMRVKRLVRRDQKAVAAEDGAPAPVQESEPVTVEDLERRVRHGQWDSEKNLCDQYILQEVSALAQAKVLLELHRYGGIKDSTGSIKKNIRQHRDRLERLKELRFEIEHSPDEEPLPMPSDLIIPTADLESGELVES